MASVSSVAFLAVEPVAKTLVGSVGVDVGKDPQTEAAQNAGLELVGVAAASPRPYRRARARRRERHRVRLRSPWPARR